MISDIISPEEAVTLSGLFSERLKRSSDAVAYRQFDPQTSNWQSYTWAQMAQFIARYQAALKHENLKSGAKVAIMAPNSIQWAMMEQAALGLDLVIVPLFTNDSAYNVAYIIEHADVELFFFCDEEQWMMLNPLLLKIKKIKRFVSIHPVLNDKNERLISVDNWLPVQNFDDLAVCSDPNATATIVYTSGTTGRPKGVMLSHQNILANAYACLSAVTCYPEDHFLSFLPLSHMLERTGGYYLPMASGSCVSFARSVQLLGEDLLYIKPTVLVSVPRIFERIYGKIQEQLTKKSAVAVKLFNLAVDIGWQRFLWQQKKSSWQLNFLLWPLLNVLVAKKVLEKFGGKVRFTVSGGASLSVTVVKPFLAFGMPVLNGYGLTETSPVICVNRINDNDPKTVGYTLPGIDVKVGEKNELLTRSACLMQGYWENSQATQDMIDEEGWLHTGDKVDIVDGRIQIIGRVKEIIVMSNGEKIPPTDMEIAICIDALFEQAMLIGEGKPFLSAVIVLNVDVWEELCQRQKWGVNDLARKDIHEYLLERVARLTLEFPGFAKIRRITLTTTIWTVENKLLTPTMKLKRNAIQNQFEKEISQLYIGH